MADRAALREGKDFFFEKKKQKTFMSYPSFGRVFAGIVQPAGN
jgi:hypothetical protein